MRLARRIDAASRLVVVSVLVLGPTTGLATLPT
jgi:hypothetical protein